MLKRIFFSTLSSIVLTAGMAQAEEVEIYLVDILDNIQNGYCVDIAGGKGAQADPANGLQGHTCYSPLGELLVDQIFDTEKFADGLLYMTRFDVCAQTTSNEAGTTLELAECDGSSAQSFVFSGEGTITPASATDLCFTVGEDTRFGRSNVNQIKALTLETCSADNAATQTWSTRTE